MGILKNKPKKIISVGGALILSFVSSTNVLGYSSTTPYGETSMYFADYDADTDTYTNKMSEVIRGNYWSNLQAVDVETIESDDNYKISHFKIAIPKYLRKPSETDINPHARHIDFSSFGGYEFYNFGIIPNWGGFTRADRFMFKDNPGENIYLQQTFKILDGMYNPFKFKVGVDTLTEKEATDPLNQLKVLADIKAKDSTDSKKIDEYKAGDPLELNFSMGAPWFKKLFNSHAMAKMQIGGITEVGAKELHDKFVMSDSEIVFTLGIPSGVTVDDNPTAKVSGIKGFTAKAYKDDKTLVIKLRKDERAKAFSWQNMVDKVKAVDTSKVSIDISGLSVSNDAIPGSKMSITGTASAMYDFATSFTKEFYLSSAEHNSHRELGKGHENSSERCYWTFAGVQDPAGLDEAAPKDKPNLISYTFNVTAPESDPVKPRPDKDRPRVNTDRIDGKDRIETAIDISGKHYKSANTVIVVRHDLFPDSMTASVLAKIKDAPILLNPTNKLDPRVGAEIKRLGASEVIIVGGQNSISEKVREELRIYDADKNVERIAGHDRYGTSEMVARRVVGITGKKNKAVVASGEVFPDALAVGTYASREGYPILLVRKDLVPPQITKATKDLEIKNTYIAGGYNTISKSTELKLPGVLERMAGKTRYETAIAIARSKFADSKEAYIASGEEFADALAISPMSGKYNRPTLLVRSKAGQNKIVSDYVYFKNINRITAIGGYRYIPNDVLKELVN
ncbi:MAG: cell wall-binding repeat-containing protein [Peptostreptococcus sp.]|uniref:cell wall-binding repeat-containing protein n=1 Tax=Peptostreptococcus TaxID=1257 RepID=UPI0007968549|nr:MULTISPECIES: cell wall-binding repeat-containing protein [Peptostreptococcus]KXB69866.1 putative cell wall binding repeat 2 [Peptostreptococcus anaerobius]MDU1265884.1 cell wall-binding repeat-containing protein [Peptostreptococcus sp.]